MKLRLLLIPEEEEEEEEEEIKRIDFSILYKLGKKEPYSIPYKLKLALWKESWI